MLTEVGWEYTQPWAVKVLPALRAAAKKEICAPSASKMPHFNAFPLSLITLAVLKITTPSSKLQYLATNHRAVETLIANGLSSLSIIRVIGNRYLKVISWIANFSLPSNLTLGRKCNPAHGDIGVYIC